MSLVVLSEYRGSLFYDLWRGREDSGMPTSVGMKGARTPSRHPRLSEERDIVGVTGYPGKSKKGGFHLPMKMGPFSLLSHVARCYQGLKNQETRYRQRYLDLILNQRRREYSTCVPRSSTTSDIPQHETPWMETPMMNVIEEEPPLSPRHPPNTSTSICTGTYPSLS